MPGFTWGNVTEDTAAYAAAGLVKEDEDEKPGGGITPGIVASQQQQEYYGHRVYAKPLCELQEPLWLRQEKAAALVAEKAGKARVQKKLLAAEALQIVVEAGRWKKNCPDPPKTTGKCASCKGKVTEYTCGRCGWYIRYVCRSCHREMAHQIVEEDLVYWPFSRRPGSSFYPPGDDSGDTGYASIARRVLEDGCVGTAAI